VSRVPSPSSHAGPASSAVPRCSAALTRRPPHAEGSTRVPVRRDARPGRAQVLVELAQEREESIPALIYEGRPVVRAGVSARALRRAQAMQCRAPCCPALLCL